MNPNLLTSGVGGVSPQDPSSSASTATTSCTWRVDEHHDLHPNPHYAGEVSAIASSGQMYSDHTNNRGVCDKSLVGVLESRQPAPAPSGLTATWRAPPKICRTPIIVWSDGIQ